MSSQLNPRDIVVAGLDPLQLTQTARAREWDTDIDLDTRSHFGPLATELYAIDPDLAIPLSDEPGDLALDMANVAGLAWAAAAQAGDLIATLTVRVAELEARLAAVE